MTNTMTTTERKIEDISLILKDMLKVIKVVSMYPENNPLPQSLRRSFAEKLEAIVEDYGELKIEVLKDTLKYNSEVVFCNKSKEENLAGIFFEAGITEIVLKGGLDVLEIYKLLDVIKTYMNSPSKSQDLAAMMWEAGVTAVSLRTLEDIALSKYDEGFDIQEYTSAGGAEAFSQGLFGTEPSEGYQNIFVRDEDSGKYQSTLADDSDDFRPGNIAYEAELGSSMAAGPISDSGPIGDSSGDAVQYNEIADTPSVGVAVESLDAARDLGFVSNGEKAEKSESIPDSALILNDEFKLSEEEEEQIRELIAQDADFEPYNSTLELLKEMLVQETELPGFSETVTICEKIMGEFIRAGRLVEAGALLGHLTKLEPRVRKEKTLWADRLKQAFIAAGSREKLDILAEALNAHPDIQPPELKTYLGSFGWEALSGITDLVGKLDHRQHRECILEYLKERSKDNLDLVAKGVFDKSPDVVRNAMSILVQVASDKAMSYLDKVVGNSDDSIRMDLVRLLRSCPNERAIDILQKAVRDTRPEIRRAAVSSIVSRRGPNAFKIITDIINDEKFPKFDEEDQQALLDAFSILGGEKALTYLSELILTYNHFRSRTLAFLRQAAIEALIINRSDKCDELLTRLAKNWRPDIKRQAMSAIRRRRELKYGD